MRRRWFVGVTASAAVATLAVAAAGLGSPAGSGSRCRTTQLRLAATFYGEAGGQFIQTFTFVNRSRRTCRLRGWSRLRLESRSGRPLTVFSRRVQQSAPGTTAFRTVVLRAHGAASFDVFGEDWNHLANKRCPQTTVALITPPGARSALPVAVKMPNCGEFDIAPVIAGKLDRQAWSVVWHG